MFYTYLWLFQNWFIATDNRSRRRISTSGTFNVFQSWGCSQNFDAATSWVGNLLNSFWEYTGSHLTSTAGFSPPPDITFQSFPSHGIWRIQYMFTCPATWTWIQFQNSAGRPCRLWLKLFNHTMGFFARSNTFMWSESYCEKNQILTSLHDFSIYLYHHFLRKTTSL